MSVPPGLTPSATQPNIAQITLPPGLTLGDTYVLQHMVATVGNMAICAVALAGWDYLTLFSMELALYRQALHRKQWMEPSGCAFIILRYSVFLALVPGLWFTVLQSEHCQAAAACSQVGVVLVTATAGFIFCARTCAIWKFNKAVCIPVGILYLIMIACWIAVVIQLRVLEGPATAFGSNCLLATVPGWAPLNYASSVAFDTLIIVLTIVCLRCHKDSRRAHHFINDNVFYFIVVTISNLVALIIYASKNQFAKTLIVPYPTLMTAAMGSRVYLNLKLFENDPGKPNIWGDVQMATKVPTMQFASNPAMHFQQNESQMDSTQTTIERSTDSLNTAVEGGTPPVIIRVLEVA